VLVESRKTPNKIEVLGFEYLAQSAHMLEWLNLTIVGSQEET